LASILLGTAAEEMSTNNITPWKDTYVVAMGRYDVGERDGWMSAVSVFYKADRSADAVTLGRAGCVEHRISLQQQQIKLRPHACR
jgi:hypothetical protein